VLAQNYSDYVTETNPGEESSLPSFSDLPVYFWDFETISAENFGPDQIKILEDYIYALKRFYSNLYRIVNLEHQTILTQATSTKEGKKAYKKKYDDHYNEGIADIVQKVYEKNKLLVYNNHFVQHFEPIYEYPVPEHKLAFRSKLYAPEKHFMGRYFETYWFNMVVIWILTGILYVLLYFDVFKKLLTIRIPLKRK
jgi:hypothetical protein